jgi:hypothetical protein
MWGSGVTQTATVIASDNGTNATSIEYKVVGAINYDMAFVLDSAQGIYTPFNAPTFDFSLIGKAQDAVDAVNLTLNLDVGVAPAGPGGLGESNYQIGFGALEVLFVENVLFHEAFREAGV